MKQLLIVMGILIAVLYGGYYLTHYDVPFENLLTSEEN
jgi:hypothetical protein